MPGHPIIYVDIDALDLATSAKFYKEVFDWNITVDEASNYTAFQSEGGPEGGFHQVQPGEQSKRGPVVVYLQTDDIPATLKEIEAHGGKAEGSITEIPEGGAYAFFTDPAGVFMGLYNPSMR
jgi:predicted enzyme related to lactoylglutathione lyase